MNCFGVCYLPVSRKYVKLKFILLRKSVRKSVRKSFSCLQSSTTLHEAWRDGETTSEILEDAMSYC